MVTIAEKWQELPAKKRNWNTGLIDCAISDLNPLGYKDIVDIDETWILSGRQLCSCLNQVALGKIRFAYL